MFLFRSIELLALIGLLVQTFDAWIFVAVLVTMGRHDASPPAFKNFRRAFVALAVALTAVSIRFFRAHDVTDSYLGWQDGDLIPIVFYAVYMAFKTEFVSCLVVGSYQLRNVSTPPLVRQLRWPLVVVMAAIPTLVHDVNLLLLIQAPVMVVGSIVALLQLRPLRSQSSGIRVVWWSLVALALTWSVHACAVIADGRFGFEYVLRLNSFVDLGVQLLLGIGLIVSLLQLAHQRQTEAEQEKEQLRRAMEKDDKLRALGAIVSGVAHELNNPLTVISGYAELLQEEGEESDYACIIVEQTDRCRGIVRNLSALASQSVQPFSRNDLADIVRRVVRGLSPEHLHGEKRIVVECPAGISFMADRVGIEQVLGNLIINALHASPRGGTVRISGYANSGHDEPRQDDSAPGPGISGVTLRVTDEGEGVPVEVRDKLFDPFFTTKEPGKGTGLGLSIAHAIVRHHGGTLVLEAQASTHATGASFRVFLPRTTDASSDESASAEPDATPSTLLVVDDDVAVRSLLSRLARHRGWQVTEAGSAEEALTLPLDAMGAILCDLRMPGIGGTGFHDHLRKIDPVLLERVVFITGDLASPDSVDFARRCTRPLLQKPIDTRELFARLGEAVAI